MPMLVTNTSKRSQRAVLMAAGSLASARFVFLS
jgi:hypothetical protein